MTTQSGINALHLRLHVVEPVLARLAGDDTPALASRSAVELIMGTIAVESGFRALDQITGPDDTRLGPAYGICQIEPATHADLYTNYLQYKPALRTRLLTLTAHWPSTDVQLVTNLAYAVAVARLIYWRSPVGLAKPGDVAGHAAVWKRVYNTSSGKGREADFASRYQALVAPHM